MFYEPYANKAYEPQAHDGEEVYRPAQRQAQMEACRRGGQGSILAPWKCSIQRNRANAHLGH